MTCDSCGHANPPDANFCSSCGNRLSVGEETTIVQAIDVDGQDPDFADAESASTAGSSDGLGAEELGAGPAALLVRRGPNFGTRFELQGEVTRIGRHPASDILLDDITVSRRHAEILHRHGHYSVRDVGSLNGTYLNRERIEEADLANGDEVQIGRFRLVFLRPPEEN